MERTHRLRKLFGVRLAYRGNRVEIQFGRRGPRDCRLPLQLQLVSEELAHLHHLGCDYIFTVRLYVLRRK